MKTQEGAVVGHSRRAALGPERFYWGRTAPACVIGNTSRGPLFPAGFLGDKSRTGFLRGPRWARSCVWKHGACYHIY